MKDKGERKKLQAGKILRCRSDTGEKKWERKVNLLERVRWECIFEEVSVNPMGSSNTNTVHRASESLYYLCAYNWLGGSEEIRGLGLKAEADPL